MPRGRRLDELAGDSLGKGRLRCATPRHGRHREHERAADEEEREHGDVGELGIRRVQESAQHRSEDRRDLPHHRRPRHDPRHPFGADDVRRERAGGWIGEGARHTENERDHEDRNDTCRLVGEEDEQSGGARGLDHVRHRDDPAAIEPIGDCAGDQHEQQRRREREEPEEAEVEWPSADREDLDPEHGVERRGRHRAREQAGEQRRDRSSRIRSSANHPASLPDLAV